MQTNLASWVRGTPKGDEADAILRRCVHCGFCTATCPTYQVLGDELDSPRGRIYLIMQMLEGETPTRATQQHLDRCLTCRNCETACPSGVQYGHLIDLGREWVDQKVERSLRDRLQRAALRHALNAPWFGPLMRLGKRLRPLLPAAVRRKVPAHRAVGGLPDVQGHARQVLLLSGCVQPAMMPTIDAATIRVLDAIGIGASYGVQKGCCGAINFHLDDTTAALTQMRANIDAWLPALDGGEVEAIVMNASGCGAMVKDYAHHLRHDPEYAVKAQRLVAHVKDVAELVAPLADDLRAMMQTGGSVAFHPPCTLQHWQGLGGVTERMLITLGFTSLPFADRHLCCGSAGAYSVLQPKMALTLRDRKLAAIAPAEPDVIVSANIGCIGHLQSGTDTPVRHWIEWVDTRLKGRVTPQAI